MTAKELLKRYWNYDHFRPLQAEIIDHVLAGKDTLALLPTGGGKSVCFQIPALAFEGVTLVVSPLIALMKDQVRQLRDRGIVADAIYSGMRRDDIDRVFDNAVYGNTKLLYLSPERLKTQLAQERIKRMNLSLVAVDEAHCISQWGYDFRPSYLDIQPVISELHPEVPFIAVTATATPEVVKDIQEQLVFRKGSQVFSTSFGRDNLSYAVITADNKEAKMLGVLEGVPGTSIIYVRSRGMTKQIAQQLQRRGIKAASYHAGLEPKEKDRRQEAWINGQLRVIVATNAFGMGIDKADVRTVIHYGPPDNPEAYFQEAGRGGRDGKESFAVLLYHHSDADRLRRHHKLGYPPVSEVVRTYRALGSYYQLAVGAGKDEAMDFDLIAFSQTYGFDVRIAHSCLKALQQSGFLVYTDEVHVAANLQFIVSKEKLYDYQLKNAHLVKLIKSVLRTSQGAFVQPVVIKEGNLANFLQVTTEQLQASLRKMDQEGIIAYQPEKNTPQLVFTQPRLDPDRLRLDEGRYDFLKARALHRLETMIDYSEREDVCRSRHLLEYFGEEDAAECGKCDVCRMKKKTGLPPLTPKVVYKNIRSVLSEPGDLSSRRLSALQLYQSFSSYPRLQVDEALAHLLREHLIVREEDYLRLP